VLALAMLRLVPPTAAVEILLVLGCSAAAFALGHLAPYPRAAQPPPPAAGGMHDAPTEVYRRFDAEQTMRIDLTHDLLALRNATGRAEERTDEHAEERTDEQADARPEAAPLHSAR